MLSLVIIRSCDPMSLAADMHIGLTHDVDLRNKTLHKTTLLGLFFLLYGVRSSGGSRISRRGGVDSRGGYVSKNFVYQNKRIGPLRGGCAPGMPPLDPPMRSKQCCLHLWMYFLLVFR